MSGRGSGSGRSPLLLLRMRRSPWITRGRTELRRGAARAACNLVHDAREEGCCCHLWHRYAGTVCYWLFFTALLRSSREPSREPPANTITCDNP
jgi:hypothetical protein